MNKLTFYDLKKDAKLFEIEKEKYCSNNVQLIEKDLLV